MAPGHAETRKESGVNAFRLGGTVAALGGGIHPRRAAIVIMVAPILLPLIFSLGAAFVIVGLRDRSGQTRNVGVR